MVFEIALGYENKQLNFVLTDKDTADFGGTLVRIKQKQTALVLKVLKTRLLMQEEIFI